MAKKKAPPRRARAAWSWFKGLDRWRQAALLLTPIFAFGGSWIIPGILAGWRAVDGVATEAWVVERIDEREKRQLDRVLTAIEPLARRLEDMDLEATKWNIKRDQRQIRRLREQEHVRRGLPGADADNLADLERELPKLLAKKEALEKAMAERRTKVQAP